MTEKMLMQSNSNLNSNSSLVSDRNQSESTHQHGSFDFSTHKHVALSATKNEFVIYSTQFKILQKRLKNLTTVEMFDYILDE